MHRLNICTCVLIGIVLSLAAVSCFSPADRWWAGWGLVLVISTYCRLQIGKQACGKTPRPKTKRPGSGYGEVMLVPAAVLAGGTAWGWVNGLRWTAPLAGLASLGALLLAVGISTLAEAETSVRRGEA